ncbi:hypothetical protein CAI21_16940 [Alkalilimnicola ehrlichii]|nr:hypothetical protein CAI21_16940 [Alkalilimnicola ehrlichii]
MTPVSRDARFRHAVYRLSTPLPPGERLRLRARGRLQYLGFTQDEEDPQAKITFNGSFLGTELLPRLGYDNGRELVENRERIARGLPRLASRKAPQDDPVHRRRSVFSGLSPRATADITVSTPASQTAFGPGALIARRVQGDRAISSFRLTEAAPLNWHIGSAAYEVAAFSIGRPERPVALEVLHHPGHAWNLDHIRAAADAALAHIESELGPYPYQQLRIAQIPFYAETSHAYPNVIAIPENHGWFAAVREPAGAAYVYYIVARALAAQVLAHHLDIADVQGAGLFTRTLPEHYALELVRKRFGDAVHADALTAKADDYRRGRGREPNTEPALLYSDGADYVEADKGPIVFAYLDERAGQGALGRALASFVARFAGTGVLIDSTDLLEHLERELPADLRQEMREQFLRTDHAGLPGF